MSNRNSFIESTKETDERLEALKQLYPEIFSDGKINLDAFKDVTGTSDLRKGKTGLPVTMAFIGLERGLQNNSQERKQKVL